MEWFWGLLGFPVGVIVAQLILKWKKARRDEREFSKSLKNWMFRRVPTPSIVDSNGTEHRPDCMICGNKIWDEESFMDCNTLDHFICFNCVPRIFIRNPEI